MLLSFGELLHFLHTNVRNSFSQDILHIKIAVFSFGCILSLCISYIIGLLCERSPCVVVCEQACRDNSWGPGQIINVGPLHIIDISRQF